VRIARVSEAVATGGRRLAPWLAPVLLTALALPFVAGGGRAAAAPPPSPGQDPRLRPAQQAFLSDCATCHGGDGRGTSRGPTLVGLGKASYDYWISTGRMPLVGETGRDARSPLQRPKAADDLGNPDAIPKRRPPAYTPSQTAALVDYIAQLTGGTGPGIPSVSVGANLQPGGDMFRLQCAACHAWAGDGGALLHREAPSLHRSTPAQIAEAIRIGPGAMPAFGNAAVTPDELDGLVTYVRYLDHPDDRGGNPLWHLGPAAEGGVALIVGLGMLLMATRWIGERG
jgi:ubiquinol-cytochrome c reductase cytochrome c subunit